MVTTRSSGKTPSTSSSTSSNGTTKKRAPRKSKSQPEEAEDDDEPVSSVPPRAPSASIPSPTKSALSKRRQGEMNGDGNGNGEEKDENAMQVDGQESETADANGKTESGRPTKKVKFDEEADGGGEVVGEAAEGKKDEEEKEATEKSEEGGKEEEKTEGEKSAKETEGKEKAKPKNAEDEVSGDPLKARTGILERGSLFFFYRPKVQQTEVSSLDEVARTFMVLVPRPAETQPGPIQGNQHHYRSITIGKKKLPEGSDKKKDVLWACVKKVGEDLKEIGQQMDEENYATRTVGDRHIDPSRLAVRGCYLIYHNSSGPPSSHTTYLYYTLTHPSAEELPSSPAAELGFEPSGTFIIQIRNPTASTGPNQGLEPEERAEFGKELLKDVWGGEADGGGGVRFSSIDRPGVLDFEGAEMLFIGDKGEAEDEVGEANRKDLEMTAEAEKGMGRDEVLRELKLDEEKFGGAALEGDWF